jgi:hypothetical protein
MFQQGHRYRVYLVMRYVFFFKCFLIKNILKYIFKNFSEQRIKIIKKISKK